MRVEARQLPEPRAGGMIGDCRNPAPDWPSGPASACWTRSAPTKFSRSVTSTSWTRRPRWIAVAIADHRRAERRCSDQRSGRGDPGRISGPVKRDRRGAQPAKRDLAFGADVDDARAKAERDACSRQQIGRRPIERDAELMRRADGAHRNRGEGGKRIVSRESDQRRRAEQAKGRPRRRCAARSLPLRRTGARPSAAWRSASSAALPPSCRSPGHPKADLREIDFVALHDPEQTVRPPSPRRGRRRRAPPPVRTRHRGSPRRRPEARASVRSRSGSRRDRDPRRADARSAPPASCRARARRRSSAGCRRTAAPPSFPAEGARMS